jgi:hypothetical protein
MPANSLICGAPGMTRTCDLLVRSQTLYPTELRALREVDRLDFNTHGSRNPGPTANPPPQGPFPDRPSPPYPSPHL